MSSDRFVGYPPNTLVDYVVEDLKGGSCGLFEGIISMLAWTD